MTIHTTVKRALALAVPVAAAAALAAWFVANRAPPDKADDSELVRAVSVIPAPEVAWRPRAIGYGEARPVRIWPAVAEVAGRIVHRHPDLETGKILGEGTELYRIDRTDYELAVAQAKADIAAVNAQLRELGARRTNLEDSLDIERRRLEVAKRELQRQETLLDKGSASRAAVDREERNMLQQLQAVQELESSLSRIPAERERLQAERERHRARLEQARRDLPRTVIKAPLDLRVSAVSAELDQYVRAGETLMTGDAVSATEVEAEIPVDSFRAILDPGRRSAEPGPGAMTEMLSTMGLTAVVKLRTPGGTATTAQWRGRVDRISDAIDPRTRTVGVVVVVDRPYENAEPPERPPLVKGMYVAVQVCAPTREPAVVVPRTAVHEGRVFVAGADDRLDVREITPAYSHGAFIVAAEGVDADERIVVSDPVPAIQGMKLAPTRDPAAMDALLVEARGTRTCP